MKTLPDIRQQSRTRIIAIIGGALTFVAVALLVISGWATSFDMSLMTTMRQALPFDDAHVSTWPVEALRDLTALGSGVVLTSAVLATFAYLCADRRFRLAVLLILSAVGATVASTTLKWIIDRSRPDVMDQVVPTFTASFPSGHALLTAAIVMPLAALIARTVPDLARRRVINGAALILVIAVGLSRIALGVHWPSDVLAGWCFGVAWAAATLLLAERLAA